MSPNIDISPSGIDTSTFFDMEAEQFEAARQLACQCLIPGHQWSIYGQALAVSAFTEWLDYRAPRLQVEAKQCSLYQLDYAHLIDAVSLLRVGAFRVCLLPQLAMGTTDWLLPKAVLDLPALAAHLYVVVGIDEEESIAAIQGFLSHDQLQNLTADATPDADWNYALPLCDLNADTSDLLLNLECLEPVPLVCPQPQAVPTVPRPQLAETILARRTHPVDHPWTWEQLVAILSDAPLRAWVYEQVVNTTVESPIPTTKQGLQQTLIDVQQWFSDQAQTVCEELAWQLLPPPLSPAVRFDRLSDEPLDNLLYEIRHTEKLDLPQSAVRACTNIVSTPSQLRLYGISWKTETQWFLVLVLGAPPGNAPALGAAMQVADPSQVLWDGQLQDPQHYLYVQLAAQFDEVLTVTVTPPAGDANTYLFTCRPSVS